MTELAKLWFSGFMRTIALRLLLILILGLSLTGDQLFAGGFRRVRPLSRDRGSRRPGATRSREPASSPLSDGALRAAVERRAVALTRENLSSLAAAWNRPEFSSYLSPSFTDRDRILDSFLANLPGDARLRLLGIEGVTPLETSFEANDDGVFETRLLAVVTLQAEFDDPYMGLQRRTGRHELLLSLRQRVKLPTSEDS